jgi:hypothetical protein
LEETVFLNIRLPVYSRQNYPGGPLHTFSALAVALFALAFSYFFSNSTRDAGR